MRSFVGQGSRSRSVKLLFVALLTVAVAGCGERDIVGVTGKITYDGQPATTGAVTFQPAPGQPAELQPASGAINPDGTYKMASGLGDGVPPGKYRVAVESMEPVELENPVQKWLIPAKFANPDTSGLTAEISPSGPSSVKIDFDLPK